METINKCIAIALSELGKLSFSGDTVIPAGKAMNALYLASAEIKVLMAQKPEKETEKKTEKKTEECENA